MKKNNMELPKIPENLDGWNIEILEELMKWTNIESETFDFKGSINELDEHICAMANTKGGYLVLGIQETKSKDGKHVIKFEKNGMSAGEEENIKRKIGNAVLNIDPNPEIKFEHCYEHDKKQFFTIIQIPDKLTSKPYFLRSTDQCFVRIGDSKTRATRSLILHLFSSTVEQIKNIQNLYSTTFLVKEELERSLKRLQSIGAETTSKVPPIDLNFIRNAINLNYLFLLENDLLRSSSKDNFIHLIHIIELLNTKINTFNHTTNTQDKEGIIKEVKQQSYTLYYDLQDVSDFLNKVIILLKEYLEKHSK